MSKGFLIAVFITTFFLLSCSQENNGTNQSQCIVQNQQCCTKSGCIGSDIECVQGYIDEFKGCDEKCMPNWECVYQRGVGPDINEKYCEKDDDCGCGTNTNTDECFIGNKKYINESKQCPDFCAFMPANGNAAMVFKAKCANNSCIDNFELSK